ncbi:MAG: biotin/lipoyl-binding protein, partial [Armatimonadota bacterium]
MPLQDEVKVAGTVTSTIKGRALVTPPVAGKVLQVFVSQGQLVKKGQRLATIQSPDLAQATSAVSEAQRQKSSAQADLEKSRSDLKLAQSRLISAQDQLKRQNALAKAGAFGQPSLQSAESALSEAEKELRSALADEKAHQVQLDRAERLFRQELVSRSEWEQA